MSRSLTLVGSPVVGLRSAPRGLRRDPRALWVQTLATLGVYGLVTHYRFTEELRALTSSTLPSYRFRLPGWAGVVLLSLLGPVEAFSMSTRIRRCGMLAGVESRCGSFTAAACWFLGAAHAYQQRHLNEVWDHLDALDAARTLELERARGYVRPARPPETSS